MSSNFFITGTDTGVGKTWIASILLNYLNNLGKKTLAFKPVSAGCEETLDELHNQDALELAALASLKIPYAEINPIAFKEPIAPHIAAEKLGIKITLIHLIEGYNELKNYSADHIIVEGAGGWRVPINNKHYLSDFVKVANIPVILVVGIRLGCINHSLLTYEAIQKDGVKLAGWIANVLDPKMLVVEENVACLKNRIKAPLLGTVPYCKNMNFKKTGEYLDFNFLSTPHNGSFSSSRSRT